MRQCKLHDLDEYDRFVLNVEELDADIDYDGDDYDALYEEDIDE